MIKQLVDSEASESLPASIVKLHHNSTVLIDEDAASRL